MTILTEEQFLNRLLEVVYKLTTLANTQGARFRSKWIEYLSSINDTPPIISYITLDKEKFINDIDYRITMIKNIKISFKEGLNSIKYFLETLYKSYFNDSDLFKKDFSKEDQIILKYYAAKEILGSLIQYNQIDHDSVDLKYNIIARNYLLLKIQGLKDFEVLENMKKLNIEIDPNHLKQLMEEIQADGIINIFKKGENFFYSLNKDLKFSDKGKDVYHINLRQLIEWPTEFWRSFYNIRELNVSIDQNTPHHDFLEKILINAALQGYTAADKVFTDLITYYETIKEESN